MWNKVSLELLGTQRNTDMNKTASFSTFSSIALTFNMLHSTLQDVLLSVIFQIVFKAFE